MESRKRRFFVRSRASPGRDYDRYRMFFFQGDPLAMVAGTKRIVTRTTLDLSNFTRYLGEAGDWTKPGIPLVSPSARLYIFFIFARSIKGRLRALAHTHIRW